MQAYQFIFALKYIDKYLSEDQAITQSLNIQRLKMESWRKRSVDISFHVFFVFSVQVLIPKAWCDIFQYLPSIYWSLRGLLHAGVVEG